MVDGEASDQFDRVLVGADALPTSPDQLHGECAASAALPEDLNLSHILRSADRHNDLTDQGTQQLLAVSVGGRLRAP